VTAGDVLKRVQQAARTRQYHVSNHAWDRMNERRVTLRDVKSAMESATSATWDETGEAWKINGGIDLDGDSLVLCVVVNWDVLIVTVF
jgi:hypothetical protein